MQFNWKEMEMTMLKKLMLMLFLSLVMSGTAAPILKSYFGIGSTTAHAADTQGDDDAQGDENDDEQ
jgi:hypothetical protein